jgi:hypothetical protein
MHGREAGGDALGNVSAVRMKGKRAETYNSVREKEPNRSTSNIKGSPSRLSTHTPTFERKSRASPRLLLSVPIMDAAAGGEVAAVDFFDDINSFSLDFDLVADEFCDAADSYSGAGSKAPGGGWIAGSGVDGSSKESVSEYVSELERLLLENDDDGGGADDEIVDDYVGGLLAAMEDSEEVQISLEEAREVRMNEWLPCMNGRIIPRCMPKSISSRNL